MYKPEWLSQGAEELLSRDESAPDFDVVVVGSGYGGAVAAARLAACQDENGKPLTVCVLERGREHLPRTFPSRFSDLPGHVRFSRFDDPVAKGVRDGLLDLRIGQDVMALVANGLGGGSLINAGVAERPEWDVFDHEWPEALRKEWGCEKSAERDDYYRRARDELGATRGTTQREKHAQFIEFANGLGLEVVPAAITVDHEKCLNCGNCATGCNVGGARKTLSSTYLAQAWQLGAAIYTGATVSRVEKTKDGQWQVLWGLTTPSRPLQEKSLSPLRARNVILAAGTLGSTEILMRSRKYCRELTLSQRLGERFSTNGDMISALYGQNRRVNAAPKESTKFDKERGAGPTITAIARSGTTRQDRVVLEELTIPAPLRRVVEEVLTTSAMAESFGRPDNDDHKLPRAVDAAAVDPDLIDRTQFFATMGDDGAAGRLELVPGWDDKANAERASDGAIRIHWPGAGAQKIYEKQDELLRKKQDELGGTYLRNPLWRPLPDGLTKALSGPKPTGLVFSMHPLGGCRMADNIEHGVVDHMGRVFSGVLEDEGVHKGLLVLDGSIVPTALGINPLLTITALAERAVRLYCGQRGWVKRNPPQALRALPAQVEIERRREKRPDASTPEEEARIHASEALTSLQFSERMTGEIRFQPGAPPMEAELILKFKALANVPAFLRSPLRRLEIEEASLRVREPGAELWGHKTEVRGSAELLVRGASTAKARRSGALAAYRRLRGLADARAKLGELWDKFRREGVLAALCEIARIPALIKSYRDLATHIGEVRYLFYDFQLEPSLPDTAGNRMPAALHGRKTLKYDAADPNPWRQLMDLTLTGASADGKPFEMGVLSVDLAYFFRGFTSHLQIARQRDLPASWMDLASLALFIARVVLKIHFWSFRLPEYQKYDPMRDLRRLPGELAGVEMERHIVGYPETPRDAGVFLPLTRYRKSKDVKREPVLLIHGLGSGGIQFATRKVQRNLVQHLADKGFDVWVAELRTSIALPYSLDQWTLDEVARGDIARIVDKVLQETGGSPLSLEEKGVPQLHVVAHCIGSAMFCTAVLDGRLQHTSGHSKIRSAVLLQVGPLITLSKGTRLRALAAAPLQRFLPDGHLDFSVDERAGWVQALIDRLLSTYPYPVDEAKHHRLGWSRRHNAHIANCNRWAAIDGRMIRHDNLVRETLDGLGEILGHASITTWTQTVQYAFLERLTDSAARNSYVTTENVRDYFTFPVRFVHGAENDVFDPLTSLRSQELIERVHGRGAADVKVIKRYSHLDPLIGRNAEHDVFGFISEFLQAPVPARNVLRQAARKHYYVRRPLVGPVLGWLRQDEQTGTWRARIWCRIDDLRSPATCAVAFNEKGDRLKVVPCPTQAKWGEVDSLAVGPIDTTLCLDVGLGAADFRQIVVLSVHESAESELPQGLHQAEASADKPRSASKPAFTVPDKWPTLEGALGDPDLLRELRDLAGASTDPTAYDPKIDCATIPDPAKPDALTFALASCRYPGWLFDRGRADALFGELLNREIAAPAALFLVGDQIYADATAGAFDPKDRRERFNDAYREAWTAPNASKVLSSLPVYMMMDDHEAGNDWHPQDFLTEEERAMRSHGLEAYRDYQWVHSPGNVGQPDPLARDRKAFYYSFRLNGFPVFVCDTRSGRAGQERILDVRQYRALARWLHAAQREHRARPKFVVSPSLVVPFLKDSARYPSRSDAWDGFPRQLARLFTFICRRKIENVVFLCGDSHSSLSSEIWFTDNKQAVGPNAYCIMASPMYAPYPFANSVREQFVEDNTARPFPLRRNLEMLYKAAPLSHAAQDSITFVAARQAADGKWLLSVRVQGEGGRDLATAAFPMGQAGIRKAAADGGERAA